MNGPDEKRFVQFWRELGVTSGWTPRRSTGISCRHRYVQHGDIGRLNDSR
ncbi:hypothetical protein GQ600_9336 [Phytophthora cactorum]|nr:hypothetical protein GQ600_9336 [Phytophthora cactorum]